MKPAEQSRIERNRPLHASPGYAQVVGRGINKPTLPPERVRELMEEQRRKVEPEEDEPARPAINWEEEMKSATFPSARRLSTFTPAEQRVLESRYYHGRNTHRKTDVQLSAELDVCLADLDDLAAVVRRQH